MKPLLQGRRPPFFVLADDLAGALTVASLISERLGPSTAMALNVERMGTEAELLKRRTWCLCVNLEVRGANPKRATHVLDRALRIIGKEYPIAFRIDGLLRGPIEPALKSLLRHSYVLLTDTIPELKRYTKQCKVHLPRMTLDLVPLLLKVRTYEQRYGHRVIVADAKTHSDLKRWARICLDEGFLPVDPGPLIAHVVTEAVYAWKGNRA